MIKAEIVAHSLSSQGDELISVLCTFPRIILAEVNTHRMLSKNTSSSRAIPFNKMVEAIQNDPFIPIAWQKEHKGMQGNEYLTPNTKDLDYESLERDWLQVRDFAVQVASELNDNGEGFGVTKQLCNRLLEPFMWTTMLITGSREGWENFFSLRCPDYTFHNDINYHFKSKKDVIAFGKSVGDTKIEYPDGIEVEMEDLTELDWLKLNKGQAEIHIMDLAEKIYDAVNESTPNQLEAGEWHIPMISDLESLKLSTDDQIKLSVGRAANTSYTVVGDGKELTLEHAIKIHDKCVELVHSSVFEHCARAMNDDEYYTFVKGRIIEENKREDGTCDSLNLVEASGWCFNLKGFISYRYIIDNKKE